jgi:hypothetical protein
MFGSNTTEHQLSSSALVPLGGQLPYYQEMRTVKLLDFLMTLFKNREPDKTKLRKKLNQFLYSRTKPGFYIEIIKSDLHLAYADQRDGHGSQHWWRLFFSEKWKAKIENILNNAALIVSETASTNEKVLQGKANALIEWGGMYFRSKTEVRIAEELYKRNVLFFSNVRGQIGCQGSPATEASGWLTGRIEVDFLVFHKNKCLILEVDGQHHQEGAQTFRDYVRDRVFLREGIPTARFTADECFNRPADVVAEFLNMF